MTLSHVWIVERGHENVDGPELDVFYEESVAKDHADRARRVLGDKGVWITEQAILTESYLPRENE